MQNSAAASYSLPNGCQKNGAIRKAIQRIQQLCCLGLGGEAVVPILLRELHHIVPSASNLFFWTDEHGEITDAYGEVPELFELIPLYMAEFYNRRDHEAIPVSLSTVAQGEGVEYLRRIATDNLNHSPGFYNEIMRTAHYGNIVCTRIKDHGKPVGLVLQGMGDSNKKLSAAEEDAMVGLVPFIAHALKPGDLLRNITAPSEELGLMIFTCEAKLLHLTRAAKMLLYLAAPQRLCTGGFGDGDLIPANVLTLCHRLRAIFGSTAERRVPVWNTQNRWGRFVFRAHWLAADDADTGEIAVTIQREVPEAALLWQRIRQWGLLPPRQAEVCLYLACGLSYPDIAHRLGVSRTTVAFHARELYTRMDVRHSNEIAAKLLNAQLRNAQLRRK